jgi:hypothetical protein
VKKHEHFTYKLQWDSFGCKTPDDGPMWPKRVVEWYRKKKFLSKVALKTEYFSVYEVYINATGCLDII